MNIFNRDNEKNKSETITGFRAASEKRQEILPQVEEAVQGAFQNYNGEMVVVVRVHEDENFDPVKTQIIISGISSLESITSVLEALDDARQDILNSVGDMLKDKFGRGVKPEDIESALKLFKQMKENN